MAKLTKRQTARHRESIKVGNIIARVQKNALGTLTSPLGEPIEMSASQLKAAQLLLDKALPNLQATTLENITPDYVNQDPRDLQRQLDEIIRARFQGMTPEQIQASLNRELDS